MQRGFDRNWILWVFRKMLLAWKKLVVGPIRYAKGRGYDAERYWRDRFDKHGLSLRGPGVEGDSEQKNKEGYEQAGAIFLELLRKEAIDFSTARVAEIGMGTGFYTDLLAKQGTQDYVGVDITDVLFGYLRKRHPNFRFEKKDVTADRLEGHFDLMIMMDVIEHIVEPQKLTFALKNIQECLTDGGILVLSGVHDRTKKLLFYLHSWSPEEIRSRAMGLEWKGPIPFRANDVMLAKKPHTSEEHLPGGESPDRRKNRTKQRRRGYLFLT